MAGAPFPLGEKWTAPGQLLTGLVPNVDFYLFVVAKDAKEIPSQAIQRIQGEFERYVSNEVDWAGSGAIRNIDLRPLPTAELRGPPTRVDGPLSLNRELIYRWARHL